MAKRILLLCGLAVVLGGASASAAERWVKVTLQSGEVIQGRYVGKLVFESVNRITVEVKKPDGKLEKKNVDYSTIKGELEDIKPLWEIAAAPKPSSKTSSPTPKPTVKATATPAPSPESTPKPEVSLEWMFEGWTRENLFNFSWPESDEREPPETSRENGLRALEKWKYVFEKSSKFDGNDSVLLIAVYSGQKELRCYLRERVFPACHHAGKIGGEFYVLHEYIKNLQHSTDDEGLEELRWLVARGSQVKAEKAKWQEAERQRRIEEMLSK